MHTIDHLLSLVQSEFEKQNFISKPIELYEPIDYTMSQGGKRIRPVLCLMGCDLFDGEIESALYPAMGIEIFHNFTLLHDDIMDNAPIRRGKETVYKKWNSNIAILSGDTMYAMAYKYIIRTKSNRLAEIIDVITQTAIEICEGQQFDMNFETLDHVSIEDYLNMIRLKTAVLLGASLKIGAIIANAKNTETELIYKFGENIGMAFQLKDDLLDIYSDESKFGKKTGGDIIANKKTFLYLKAIEQSNAETSNRLKELFSSTELDSDIKVNSVKDIFNKYDIQKLTEEKMDSYYQAALLNLDQINLSITKKDILKKIAEILMSRDH
jgi:geranylgeranyl diphosphate synthase type II